MMGTEASIELFPGDKCEKHNLLGYRKVVMGNPYAKHLVQQTAILQTVYCMHMFYFIFCTLLGIFGATPTEIKHF